MALETTTYIDGLVVTNPTSSDNVGDGDNHIRLLKAAIRQTWPSIAGAVTSTHTAINSAVATANTATNANTASAIVKRDAAGNFIASGITANLTGNVVGNVTGNVTGTASNATSATSATQATRLSTARDIILTGDVTGTASFQGDTNATITTTVANNSHNHTIANITGLQTELTRIEGTVSGAAVAAAAKWSTPRTISLTGDVTGSVSIDGSANVSMSATVADNSHAHTIANVTGLQQSLNTKLDSTSNAASATKLATARSISLSGAITGNTQFDGSGNVTLSTTSNISTANISDFATASASASAAGALAAYPVGAIFASTVATSPAVSLGGSWISFGAGRVLVGLDSGDADFNTAQGTGGAKSHTLSVNEIPSHTHTVTAMASTSGTLNTTGSSPRSASGSITSSATGGGQAHNIVQPYIVVYMWKRVS